ncbi:SGNH/GDSL hydrolase family protein [Streptomyces roseirectus]|uniref:SGNH/GDSL hydrolase family protein n=1 Tax=Streptomyces roseirectus TaxID=2768066 RepID=A0A7H0I845_9ACTN|nr:GDSL-type esterase/lipase family protein [Streptomyces roseirectus]QNP68961.1 SGNH/GDSL hydrolase family protein [Streptomyces roseirectus]
MPDEHTDPRCLAPGEAGVLLAGAGWRRAVVLGDSVADSAGMAVVPGYARTAWSDRVAGALREGDAGAACLQLRARRELSLSEVRSCQLADALGFGADLALLACGGPESRARSFEPDALELELSRILAALRGAGCRTVVVITPFDLTRSARVPAQRHAVLRARRRLLAERVEAVTLRHGCVQVDLAAYADAYARTYPDASGTDPWSAHPWRLNSRGHALTAAAVVRTLGGSPGS